MTETSLPSMREVDSTVTQPPELFINTLTLYHGSGTPGIEDLNVATEDTVGRGIYLVDNPRDASGYASRRSREKGNVRPIVYETKVENLKLVNLDNQSKLDEVMQGFAGELQRLKDSDSEEPWYVTAAIEKAQEEIRNGVHVGQVKKAVFSHTRLFTDYLYGLGYDGLKTIEGGEADDVGEHETYLIFDPRKVKVTGETPTS
jgi:hypothetical protein